MTKFEKRVGGWAFRLGNAEFLAVRNIAGFAHRDWEVRILDGTSGGTLIEDQLESRKACVEAIEDKTWLWQDPSQTVRYEEDIENVYSVDISVIVGISPSAPMSDHEIRKVLLENALDRIKADSPDAFVEMPEMFQVEFIESRPI